MLTSKSGQSQFNILPKDLRESDYVAIEKNNQLAYPVNHLFAETREKKLIV